jgi:lipoprotein-releasing system permease protein
MKMNQQLPTSFMFTWRYFTSRKSVHAITIISRITTISIAVGTAALIIVLSIFNGFEGLVKDLYASFYPDIRIIHKTSPQFEISEKLQEKISSSPGIDVISLTLESNGLFQYDYNRVNIVLKGVDPQYESVNSVTKKIVHGKYNIGNAEQAYAVIGSGVENALQVQPEKTLIPVTAYLPKKNAGMAVNPMEAISTFQLYPSGSFTIQQDFDNRYALTNLKTVQEMLGVTTNTISSVEIKLQKGANERDVIKVLQQIMGATFLIENRYQQNRTLFSIMQSEKWIIFGILSFILILASFNMISTLTLLILEKEKDIQILKALGSGEHFIRKIFLGESLLVGMAGGLLGLMIAIIFCFLQEQLHMIPLQGSFVIDYYPVKMMISDVCAVLATVAAIALFAGAYPSMKAAKKNYALR